MSDRLTIHAPLYTACLLSLIFSADAAASCPAIPALNPPNAKVVISDLHLGPGKTADGRWHPLEDFRFDDTFQTFIASLGDASDLVIAGDFIDFWQILPELDRRRLADLGSTESDSMKKLEAAIKSHRQTFNTLRGFSRRGRNRLFLIPGNHDIDLAWPRVQQRLLRELGDSGNRRIMVVNPCYQADGIYVEHGNEYDEANRFQSQERPFNTILDKTWLQTNFGSTFMSRFYNQVETSKPFIDNLYPELAAVAWALRSEPVLSSLPHAGRFAVMLALSQTSLKNLGFAVSELGPPEAKEELPAKTVENLLRRFDSFDPELAKVLRTIAQDAPDRAEAAELVTSIPDVDWQRLHAGSGQDPATLKVVLEIDPYVEAARKIVIKNPDVDVVIMGHTHETDRTDVTRVSDAGATPKWYVNSGSWQKGAAVGDIRSRIAWSQLDLDNAAIFPEHFSYVVVTYDNDAKPRVSRKFWPR